MSIASDVTRIESAKAAIKAAIEGKGVTVPDATLLDGMAALIESIEAGGDFKIASGTKVLSEPLSSVEFEHNFGERANFIAIFTSESSYSSTVGAYSIIATKNRNITSRMTSSGINVFVLTGTNTGNSSGDRTLIIGGPGTIAASRRYNVYSDDNKLYINGYCEDGMVTRLKDGVEYIWIASTWSDG